MSEIMIKYIVAIDFGTARTGFAWGIKGAVEDRSGIHLRTEWPKLPSAEYPKTYSTLFLRENGSWIFGGEAEDAAISNERGTLFNRIKMDIYDPESNAGEGLVIENGEYIRKAGGKSYKSIDLVSKFLSLMKSAVLDNMKANLGSNSYFTESDFNKHTLWVITVPAGATNEQKYFMRKAAEKAGLISSSDEDFDRLLFALEPEAAILSCIQDNISQKYNDKEQTIVVFDAGGGTVDVTARQYIPAGNGSRLELKAIDGVFGECANAGSTFTDLDFVTYLDRLFGSELINDFIAECKQEYFKMLKGFYGWVKGKESTTTVDAGSDINIQIDVSELMGYYEEKYPDEYENFLSRNSSIISGRRNKYLNVNRNLFIEICKPTFEKAYVPLRNTLRALGTQGVKCDSIYFVGGFSCCPYLREYIKQRIKQDTSYGSQINYVEPVGYKMSSPILIGAVLFGENPGLFSDRLAKLSYGTDVKDNGFFYLVRRGDKVSYDDEIVYSFVPVSPTQVKMNFTFYSTTKENVTHITDDSLTELEKVTIEMPDTSKGLERSVLLTLKFGGTELTATMKDTTSGNTKKVSLHFPVRWG